jgi:hypothetical protein
MDSTAFHWPCKRVMDECTDAKDPVKWAFLFCGGVASPLRRMLRRISGLFAAASCRSYITTQSQSAPAFHSRHFAEAIGVPIF